MGRFLGEIPCLSPLLSPERQLCILSMSWCWEDILFSRQLNNVQMLPNQAGSILLSTIMRWIVCTLSLSLSLLGPGKYFLNSTKKSEKKLRFKTQMNRDIPIIIYYATHIGENASKFCKVRYLSHCTDLGDVCTYYGRAVSYKCK